MIERLAVADRAKRPDIEDTGRGWLLRGQPAQTVVSSHRPAVAVTSIQGERRIPRS